MGADEAPNLATAGGAVTRPPADDRTISEATKKAFGKRFRAARLGAGLTQHQVAETLGVNRSYLSLVENGNENLTIETMTSLAQAVGLELHILLEQPVRSSRRKK